MMASLSASRCVTPRSSGTAISPSAPSAAAWHRSAAGRRCVCTEVSAQPPQRPAQPLRRPRFRHCPSARLLTMSYRRWIRKKRIAQRVVGWPVATRLPFFSYIVAKMLSVGWMADSTALSIPHRGSAGLVPEPLKRPPGASLVVSVNLVARCTQARDTVAFKIALPSEKFVDRGLYTRQASSIEIRPLRTAKTRVALRRIVHRLFRTGRSGRSKYLRGVRDIEIVLMTGIEQRRV